MLMYQTSSKGARNLCNKAQAKAQTFAALESLEGAPRRQVQATGVALISHLNATE